MMKSAFWHINCPPLERKLARWDDDKIHFEIVKCPVDEGHNYWGKRLTDLHIILPDCEMDDFIWTWGPDCVVQERTLDLLRSEGVTGFEVKPVRARFKKSTQPPPRLWELIVTGWGGMARPESGIRPDESNRDSCSACGRLMYTGLKKPEELIDEEQWDGSDFFVVWPMRAFRMVTDRVAQFVRACHLTGFTLTPVSQLRPIDEFGTTPLRHDWFMPDARARQLGEPLGIY